MSESMGVYKRGDRWYVRWKQDGRLVRKSLGQDIKTKAQATDVWRTLQKRRREGKLGLLDPSQDRLDKFRRDYLEHRRPLGYSPQTLRRDDQALRSLAEVVGGECLLRSIKQRKVDAWAGVLLARGVYRP